MFVIRSARRRVAALIKAVAIETGKLFVAVGDVGELGRRDDGVEIGETQREDQPRRCRRRR
jgi:hypothetical protein